MTSRLRSLPFILILLALACHRSELPVHRSPLTIDRVASAVHGGRRVFFIGLDGADWQYLDRLIADGAMPNLGRLVREGDARVLVTQQPPLSPLVWTTMMTGVSPLEHRVLDFTRFNPANRIKEPITSDERAVPAVWNMATWGGRRVAVFGLWATYPAEEVDGLVVSDRLFSYQYAEGETPPGAVFPKSEEAWAVRTRAGVERAIGYDAIHGYIPSLDRAEYDALATRPDPFAQPVTALRRILIETELMHRLARERIAREAPELAIVYFQGTDAIGHLFAPYVAPRLAGISEADFARYSGVPRAYFARIDAILGDWRKLAEEHDAELVIASDHGFLWAEGRTPVSSLAVATAGKWHREEGIYLQWSPRGVAEPSPSHTKRAGVAQICSTLLALCGLPQGEGLAPAIEAPSTSATVDYRRYYHRKPQASSSSAGSNEAIAKLKALGYIGSAESSHAPADAQSTRTAGSFNNEGLILRSQARNDDAVRAFEGALRIDPHNASALWNLSDLLHALGRDAARSDALLIEALKGGLPDAPGFVIARAVERSKASSPSVAIQLLDSALSAAPNTPQFLLYRGRYKLQLHDCRTAAADFKSGIALAPQDAMLHASLGTAQLCLGDIAAARAALMRSLEINPQQPEVERALRAMAP
ncbi:MAG TPA: alkaline phosphatase family protein [Thermoanaerobaculia bacterium]|nr:alkaline phosphatase family protein [Thermoanaerobaculia bacterium]